MDGRLLFSKVESAQTLGVSVRMLEGLILQKKISPRRIGRRVLIAGDELRRFASGEQLAKRAQ
jgi:hypothetical protein